MLNLIVCAIAANIIWKRFDTSNLVFGGFNLFQIFRFVLLPVFLFFSFYGPAKPYMDIAWGGSIVFILYVCYQNRDHFIGNTLLKAGIPYFVLFLYVAITKAFFTEFYEDHYNSFSLIAVVVAVWTIAFGINASKQSKALQKEQEQRTKIESENVILEQIVKERTEEILKKNNTLQETIEELKQTQDQLVQQEKLASLGELTAGIAHEIQNPLNFVNNFSEVSIELIQDLKEELAHAKVEGEPLIIIEDLIGNLQKISQHGGRASGIVKSMLEHSRARTGEKQTVNINALLEEYVKLGFHGMRAKDKTFNSDFKLDLEEATPQIEAVPQDLGRVFLNLVNNAFYAVHKRNQSAQADYKPLVTASTKLDGNKLIVSVADNGNGIPEEILPKIFQPFFTTKPTGQGTGLGLSLSYDIITKGLGGYLEVKSTGGEGTTFTITLDI